MSGSKQRNAFFSLQKHPWNTGAPPTRCQRNTKVTVLSLCSFPCVPCGWQEFKYQIAWDCAVFNFSFISFIYLRALCVGERVLHKISVAPLKRGNGEGFHLKLFNLVNIYWLFPWTRPNVRDCDVKMNVSQTFLPRSLQSNDMCKQSLKIQTDKGLREWCKKAQAPSQKPEYSFFFFFPWPRRGLFFTSYRSSVQLVPQEVAL